MFMALHLGYRDTLACLGHLCDCLWLLHRRAVNGCFYDGAETSAIQALCQGAHAGNLACKYIDKKDMQKHNDDYAEKAV